MAIIWKWARTGCRLVITLGTQVATCHLTKGCQCCYQVKPLLTPFLGGGAGQACSVGAKSDPIVSGGRSACWSLSKCLPVVPQTWPPWGWGEGSNTEKSGFCGPCKESVCRKWKWGSRCSQALNNQKKFSFSTRIEFWSPLEFQK